MRKMSVAVLLVAIFCFSSLAVGQAQPPISNEPATGQQSSGSQMRSEQLSPEAREKLIKKVQSALLKLPRLTQFDNIEFKLDGRSVTLLGQVRDSSLKPDAEKAVRKVEGVENVVNDIEVLPPSTTDYRLGLAVRRALSTGPLFKYAVNQATPSIRIIVKNARVSLEGVVDSEGDKTVATIKAQTVPGVLSVTNNLRVVKP